MDLFEMAKELQPRLVEIRHYLHSHPELGHDLPMTRAFVCGELDRLGIPYELPECGGIIGYIGKKGGKRILLRADMDALPIKEQTGLSFESVNTGKMHACGHDTHMTMLLGAAELLKQREAELPGEVVLCFQEAEEIMDGALPMISSGALDPLPERAFAFHVFPSETLPTGTVSCTAGKYMTSIDEIRITVRGKSSHGSAPHNGNNPILAAMKIIQSFTDLIRYEVDAQSPSVLTICQIHSGTASNIIPDSCTFSGTLRMVDEEKRAYVKTRIQEIVSAAETAYRVRVELSTNGMPMVFNDPEFTRQAHDWIAEMPGAKVEPVGSRINMVSEDFAEFGMRVPSAMFEIASRSPEGKHFPGHNPCVLFDDQLLYQGSAAYAQVALRYLMS
jgi:amidohydrolase